MGSSDELRAIDLHLGILDTTWTETAKKAQRTVPTAALRSIEMPRDHGRGASEGMGLGLLIGAGTGVAVALVAGGTGGGGGECGNVCGPGFRATVGGLVGGALGLVLGGIVGAIVGHSTVLEFASSQRQHVLAAAGGELPQVNNVMLPGLSKQP